MDFFKHWFMESKEQVFSSTLFLLQLLNFAASTSYFDSLAEAAGSGLRTVGLKFEKSALFCRQNHGIFREIKVFSLNQN